MARGRGGDGPSARRALPGEEGQSSVEYLAVTLAVLAMVVALGAIVRLGAGGELGRLAHDAASHSVASGIVSALRDVLAF